MELDVRALQYWHKLEHFYPYVLQEQKSQYIRTYLVGEQRQFPNFESPVKDEEKEVRGYCVYLGIFGVAPALTALEDGIGQKMRFKDCGKDESCFCMFRLSSDGIFLPESFQISSFPWAIHRVRDGKINIDQWDEDFYSFQRTAFSYLYAREMPVDYEFLLSVRELFAKQMNWGIRYCPEWMRIDMVMGRRNERKPTPADRADDENEEDDEDEEIQSENETTDEQLKKNDLLNSFYIRDLERVIEAISTDETCCGEPLRRFLSLSSPARINIEKDSDAMFALLSPRLLPLGRWPSNYGARLMQQIDVNAFLTTDPSFAQPLFSVNGPPGTGKTTLLKDVIAGIVTKRADLLTALSTPDQAFEQNRIGSIQVGTYQNNIWRLKSEFTDFGILVASNNNGAVENITHGLPERSELPKPYDTEEYRYFAGVSDRLLGEHKTWALNAAALGKKRNRSKFAEALWPLDSEREPYNLRIELRELGREFELRQWEDAKADYKAKQDLVQQEYLLLQKAYAAASEFRKLNDELPDIEARIRTLESDVKSARENRDEADRNLAAAQKTAAELEMQIAELRRLRPFIGIRLMLHLDDPVLAKYRATLSRRDVLFCSSLPKCRDMANKCRERLDELDDELEKSRVLLEQGLQRRSELEAMLEAFRQETQMPFRIDEYVSDCGAGEHGKSSPWGYKRLNELREQLFLAALKLHEMFIIGSNHMRDNLDGFAKLLRGNATEAQAKELFAPLLQSFFLLTPVVSTTFASVGSFLRNVPAGEIAYLFVDEAGQAVPQSAAGAVWRARKVIAVGDPLQIEPVVTLHESVIQALGRYFNQPPLLMDKYTSVQTLGDLANKIGGYRTISDPDDLWVGAPLLVHSRCQRTVFQIANRIAYNDKMILATREREGTVCRWLNVHGASEWEHYVPQQAAAALPIVTEAFLRFSRERIDEQKYPALFVITPFRSAKAGLAQYFRRELPQTLNDAGVCIDPKCCKTWISDCVGTIHTFQGKEADTVLLCLGVDSGGKGAGAVDWAGERPNILNVAVTRSKQNLWIIGDQNVWCRKSYFKTALDFCNAYTAERQ